MHKYIVTIFIIIILCSNCICVYAENITDLREQSNELTEELKEVNNKLQLVQDDISENMQQLQELDNQVMQSEQELNMINEQVDELNSKISENEEKLEKTQYEYDSIQESLNERLIQMYETPRLQSIQILLEAKNISEFLGAYYAMKELAEYDKNLLETVEKQKDEIEETKQILQEAKEKIVQNKQVQQKKMQILENAKTMRTYYISKLTTEEQQLQAQVDEFNSQLAKIEAEIKFLALNSISEDYIGGQMTWPIPGYSRITSPYGTRTHPISGTVHLHSGTDVSAPMGANFVAAANGVVVKAGYHYSYGNMVIIDHGGGVQTLYAHGSEIVAQLGQEVHTGDVVLKVGSTGNSTGPHAHFEIRINGQTIDPMKYLDKI